MFNKQDPFPSFEFSKISSNFTDPFNNEENSGNLADEYLSYPINCSTNNFNMIVNMEDEKQNLINIYILIIILVMKQKI